MAPPLEAASAALPFPGHWMAGSEFPSVRPRHGPPRPADTCPCFSCGIGRQTRHSATASLRWRLGDDANRVRRPMSTARGRAVAATPRHPTDGSSWARRQRRPRASVSSECTGHGKPRAGRILPPPGCGGGCGGGRLPSPGARTVPSNRPRSPTPARPSTAPPLVQVCACDRACVGACDPSRPIRVFRAWRLGDVADGDTWSELANLSSP